MKRSPSATTRSRARGDGSFSLFPFLAVLVCAMGAIILVLLIVARSAHSEAERTPVVAERSPELNELERKTEMTRWRAAELNRNRERAETQLADLRRQFADLNEHTRQLQDRLGQLKSAMAGLQANATGNRQQQARMQVQFAQVRNELDTARRRLNETQQKARSRAGYAVIPNDTSDGRHRRPIYLECRREGVVVQPEGVLFSPADMTLSSGPGNPLNAALIAVGEHLLANKQLHSDGSDRLYPLFLVRPNGIEAYYAARSAMKSWTGEFGYELIGEDWKLEYPSPAPALGDRIKQVVNEARVREQQRASIALSREPHDRAKATPEENTPREDETHAKTDPASAPSNFVVRQPSPRYGNRVDSQSIESPQLQPSAQSTELTVNRSEEGPLLTPSILPDRPAAAPADKPTIQDPHSAPVDPPMPPGRPARGPELAQLPHQRQLEPPNDRPSRSGPWDSMPPLAAGGKSAGDAPAPETKASDNVPCLAYSRGQNWCLRDVPKGAAAVPRPIQVNLYADRLVIIPQGDSKPKIIKLGPHTLDAVDKTVSIVWTQIDSWESPGPGRYWRPVLQIDVSPEPSADARYRDLVRLFEGSGMEVRRNNGRVRYPE